jgi:hypothetical protein
MQIVRYMYKSIDKISILFELEYMDYCNKETSNVYIYIKDFIRNLNVWNFEYLSNSSKTTQNSNIYLQIRDNKPEFI